MELYEISVNRNTLTPKFEKSEKMELITLAYERLKYQQIYICIFLWIASSEFPEISVSRYLRLTVSLFQTKTQRNFDK